MARRKLLDAVFNIKATYTYARGPFVHQLALNAFNLGDQLYRKDSSFIKDLAQEIGQGVRFTYRVRFFFDGVRTAAYGLGILLRQLTKVRFRLVFQ